MEEMNTVCITVGRFEGLLQKEQQLIFLRDENEALLDRISELEEALMDADLNRYNLTFDGCTNLKSPCCAFNNPLNLALNGITRKRMSYYLQRAKAKFDSENKVENAEDD